MAVLYREVSLIQRQICTQLYVVGTADSDLVREVSFIERFHCRHEIGSKRLDLTSQESEMAAETLVGR